MTDVFISYSSKDRDTVDRYRQLLGKQGFTVFMDQETPHGVDWNTWIIDQLTKSTCVIVFWSANSVQSPNVIHEATIARQQKKLLPALLEELTTDQFPMGHYTTQAANLIGWNVSGEHAGWSRVVSDVETRLKLLLPPWVKRSVDFAEAEMMADRARVKQAENREQVLKTKLDALAAEAHDANQERDHIQAEVAALKAKQEEAVKARAELDARAAEQKRQLDDAAALREKAERDIESLKRAAETYQREFEALKLQAKQSAEASSKKIGELQKLLDLVPKSPASRGREDLSRWDRTRIAFAGIFALAALPLAAGGANLADTLNITFFGPPARTEMVSGAMLSAVAFWFLGTWITMRRTGGAAAIERAFYWCAVSGTLLVAATLFGDVLLFQKWRFVATYTTGLALGCGAAMAIIVPWGLWRSARARDDDHETAGAIYVSGVLLALTVLSVFVSQAVNGGSGPAHGRPGLLTGAALSTAVVIYLLVRRGRDATWPERLIYVISVAAPLAFAILLYR